MMKEELIERASGLHSKLANCHPSLSRGRVWCRSCGASQRVDSADCLRSGWPKCCGYTMTVDSPDEQRALAVIEAGTCATACGRDPKDESAISSKIEGSDNG